MDFCCELSPILQSSWPLVHFPGAELLNSAWWGSFQSASGIVRSHHHTNDRNYQLYAKLLSKLNMLPFHSNKVDALQFQRSKSVFRNVLQIGKLDFTISRNSTGCPAFSQFLYKLSLCLQAIQSTISFPLGW